MSFVISFSRNGIGENTACHRSAEYSDAIKRALPRLMAVRVPRDGLMQPRCERAHCPTVPELYCRAHFRAGLKTIVRFRPVLLRSGHRLLFDIFLFFALGGFGALDEEIRMKKLFLTTVALAAIATSASAADLTARPYTKAPAVVAAVYDWSGFYIGANGGWGSQRDCRTNVTTAFDIGCHDADGAAAGGQIGYRWQSSSWVFGLEAQGDWADISGSRINNTGLNDVRSKVDALGLFTA